MFNNLKEKIGGYTNRLFSFMKEKISKIKDLFTKENLLMINKCFKKENLLKIKDFFNKENLLKIKEKLLQKRDWTEYFFIGLIVLAIVMILVEFGSTKAEQKAFLEQQEQLQEQKEVTETVEETPEVKVTNEDGILFEYEELYNQNNDMIGWLKIEDTVIDYPVMQTMEDENFYLKRNFEKESDDNGCLIMDTDSVVGVGTKELGYVESKEPSSNLIIHGHNMKSGNMFGELDLYKNETYGKEHNIICFDSIYEKREYELISVFYSQVFYQHEDVFKFYKFFQADTQEEFDDWYNNIKQMSLYDTGVEAELGDEFITLSVCAYHVEDGRFVVVGKRIK